MVRKSSTVIPMQRPTEQHHVVCVAMGLAVYVVATLLLLGLVTP